MASAAIERLNMALAQGRPARAGGVWGSSYALIAARLARPVLLLVPTPLEAEQAMEDLASFDTRPTLFESLKEADRFRRGAIDLLVAGIPEALGELPSPHTLEKTRLALAVGGKLDLPKLSRELVESRYERAASVERRGEYAIRGGILDLFPLTMDQPVRIELLGDAIDSIRTFDVASSPR
jgi:transcription-repair coupling factor (superfamily II helicase)